MIKKEIEKIIKELNLNCTIKEFQDKVDWNRISRYQNLSEEFIREFKNRVDWNNISIYQKLSEPFIKEFQDKVSWNRISMYQNLSEPFIREFQDKVDIKTYNDAHKKKNIIQKRKKVKEYAKKYNLKYNKTYIYAYRNHDKLGRGIIKPTQYKKNIYYRDWHIDMREDVKNSFGFGVFPKGNTKVKVKIKDWGCAVIREDGKARVLGFEII